MSSTSRQSKTRGEDVAEIAAETRTVAGTRACRRLRRQGLVPANLYGHKEGNVFLTVSERDFRRQFSAGHRIMHLALEGVRHTGMIKEVQYDALGDRIVHVDFTRISLRERVHMRIPVETVGVAKGAASGGLFEVARRDMDVEGPAGDIPEKLEVYVSDMAVGDVIRVRDLSLPETCKFLHALPDDVVISVSEARRAAEPAAEEAVAPEAGAEPEVIGKDKDQEDKEGKESKKESKK